MKMCVSFKQHELYLYDYVKTKRSPSIYIKDLIEADMKNKQEGVLK